MTPPVTLRILPLVPGVPLPRAASARTRVSIPAGYGVQEQCLPFTAASALGVIIPSPIRFGLCLAEELPRGCRAFRSPLNMPGPDGRYRDARVFYVLDNPDCRFTGNFYQLSDVPTAGPASPGVREPGLSFFDRADQRHMVKLHLPYIWRTPPAVDTLFLPPVNRPSRVGVASGLVETDWYASPVNLVLGMPAGPLHVGVGDIVAQAIFVPRALRRPTLELAAGDAPIAHEARQDLAEWGSQLAANRSAYKALARSRQGRAEEEPSGSGDGSVPTPDESV
jgi:hypothetical protein